MPSEFERMNKPREIEEWLDTYGWRRLGYLVVQVLRHTSVTPNMVSVFAIIAAFLCGWAYLRNDLTGALLGALFMILHSTFDAADGQLARATGRGSEHGRAIDGIADNISFIGIYLLIFYGYVARGGSHPVAAFALAVAAGASHAVQSSLVEYARQLFLHYTRDDPTPSDEHPERLAERIAGASGIDRVILTLQRNYAVQQRSILTTSDRLQRAFEPYRTAGGAGVASFRDLYHASNRELVRWWALMAPNAHKLGMMAFAFVPVVFASGPLHQLGMLTYFLYDLALNLPMLGLILWQRRVDARLTERLAAA